jgi:DNA-binding transcriptional ArsR family regulator
MRDVMLIEESEQAAAILNPLRLEVLRRSDEPRTCTELAEALGETPQKIYYHVKVLERAGALERVEERRVRAIHEGYYQASARAYWLSPKLVGPIGGPRRARASTSLGALLPLAEELQTDLGRLSRSERGDNVALGFSAQVRLGRPEDRTAFLSDIQNAIQSIAKRYAGSGSPRPTAREQEPDTFRLIVACYPRPEEKSVT